MNKWTQRIAIGSIVVFYMAAFVAGCAGFNAGDFVGSEIPSEVRNPSQTTIVTTDGEEITGTEIGQALPERMTHNESERQYELWAAEQNRIGNMWVTKLQKSARWVGLIDSVALIGLDIGEGYIGLLGPLAPLGTLALGWMRKRPQDKTGEEVKDIENAFLEKLRIGKEASYNKAVEDTQGIFGAILTQLKNDGKLPNDFQIPDISIEVGSVDNGSDS